MSLKITNKCINCGICELECPNNAIYEGGVKWNYNNKKKKRKYISKKHYYIVPNKCTECIGYYKYSKCLLICPINNCIKLYKKESKKELYKKYKKISNKC